MNKILFKPKQYFRKPKEEYVSELQFSSFLAYILMGLFFFFFFFLDSLMMCTLSKNIFAYS